MRTIVSPGRAPGLSFAPGTGTESGGGVVTPQGGGGGNAPQPSGTIVFDGRAGGAQDFQAAANLAAIQAYFAPRGGEIQGVAGGATVAFTTNYDGNNKRAIRFDWPANPGQDSEINGVFVYASSVPTLCWTAVMHMGKTATGGGLGSVGQYVGTNSGGGEKVMYPGYRASDPSGNWRMYWVWPAGGATDFNYISIDAQNLDVQFDADYGVGVDVTWTHRYTPGSSGTSRVEVWRDGVSVLDSTLSGNGIGTLGFLQFICGGTRHNILVDQSSYLTDMVFWSP